MSVLVAVGWGDFIQVALAIVAGLVWAVLHFGAEKLRPKDVNLPRRPPVPGQPDVAFAPVVAAWAVPRPARRRAGRGTAQAATTGAKATSGCPGTGGRRGRFTSFGLNFSAPKCKTAQTRPATIASATWMKSPQPTATSTDIADLEELSRRGGCRHARNASSHVGVGLNV